MARSLYKPLTCTDLRLYRLTKKDVEFLAVKDIRTGPRPCRIVTTRRDFVVRPIHLGIRIRVHNGRRFVLKIIKDTMIGRKIGEFCPTRRQGKIHVNNRLERKRKKKLAQLRMESDRRKRRKKKQITSLKGKRKKPKPKKAII